MECALTATASRLPHVVTDETAHRLRRPSVLPWVLLILTAVISLFPMYWLYVQALTPTLSSPKTPPDLIPIHAALDNFARLLTRAKDYPHWALNSFIISLAVTLFHLVFDTLAGYAFAKKRFPGRELLFWIILSTLMIPPQVTLVPLYIVTRRLGLINSLWAVILPGTANVFGIFLMRQYIQTLPRELEEAARMDGCSETRRVLADHRADVAARPRRARNFQLRALLERFSLAPRGAAKVAILHAHGGRGEPAK